MNRPTRQWIGTHYIEKITDGFSIWQHATKKGIERQHGYALDDATRALLVAAAYGRPDLGATYLRFIHHACCDFLEPVNFFTAEHVAIPGPWSPDALGQALWAMNASRELNLDPQLIHNVEKTVLPYIERSSDLRSHAYLALAPGHADLKQDFSEWVVKQYAQYADKAWSWPEGELRYGNAIIPLALLPLNQKLALSLLAFLNEACTERGVPIAIGNDGWYKKGGSKALFAQQPIDPAYQVLANCAAFKETGDEKWKDEAEKFLNWFWGNNLLGLSLIDVHTASCKDALEKSRVSTNSGAESTVCYLLAQAAYREIENSAPTLSTSSRQ